MAFRFKHFEIEDNRSSMKVCTDSVLLGSWAAVADCARILDIGTGCGILALMTAQRCEALIDSIEIDEESAMQAWHNFQQSPWNNRLKVLNISLQEFTAGKTVRYDHIIANPPYFEKSLKPSSAQRTMARHSEHLSSDLLMQSVACLLEPHGKFSCVMPVPAYDKFIQHAERSQLYPSRVLKVKTVPFKDPKLILAEFMKVSLRNPEIEELTVYDENFQYSEPYKFLTHHFYLNF